MTNTTTTTTTTRGQTPALPLPEAESFPDALTSTPHWVGYALEMRDGKRTKIPKNPLLGYNASSTDPATWADFPTAHAFCLRAGYGLGFMLAAPFVGVDLDHCRDAATGALSTLGVSVLSNLDTYAEVSVSGTGVKAIAYGEKPGARCRKNGLELEIYGEKRLFALTGQRLDDAPLQVNDCQDYLDHLYRTAFGATAPTPSPRPAFVSDDDDRAILDWLTVHNPKFGPLWAGDTSAYNGDHSAADQALCNLLAFRTGDENRVDSLYRQSGLYRQKWERGDYRNATLGKAMQQGRFFNPPTGPTLSTVDTPPVDGQQRVAHEQHERHDHVAPQVAALEQENARLRAELAAERDHRATVHRLITNSGMTPVERVIAYGVVLEVAAATSQGKTSDADPEARPINCSAIAENVGLKHQTISANITKFAERGQLRKATTAKLARSGKAYNEIAVCLPGNSLADNLRTAANWQRPAGTKSVGGNGNRCPNCASTTTKKTTETKTTETTTLSCADCGHVHTHSRRTIGVPMTIYDFSDDAAAPMLDLAAMRGEPTPSTVDRVPQTTATPAPDLAAMPIRLFDANPTPNPSHRDTNTTVDRPRVISGHPPLATGTLSTVDTPPSASWDGTFPCSECGATVYAKAGTVPRCLPCGRGRPTAISVMAGGDD